MLRLAAIIPTWNEAHRIGGLVRRLKESCDEVLVCDGASEDATGARAVAAGAVVLQAPRGRGSQLALGVSATDADVVWFVHADTTVPAGAGYALRAVAAQHPWGCCAVAFEESSVWLRLTSARMNQRARVQGASTGDMGQWFRRGFLNQIGGVPDLPALEDLVLSSRASRHHSGTVAPVLLGTSGRRWAQEGYLSTTLRHWSLRTALLAGVAPRRLADLYAGAPREDAPS